MIHHVQALSREQAAKYVAGTLYEARDLPRTFGDRIAWIAISDDGTSPIEHHVRAPHLLLAFADVNPDKYPGMSFENCMTAQHAGKIVALVQRLAQHPDPWAILVHCHAGVSRSGAVAEWVKRRHASMDNGRFQSLHRHCAPNSYVTRLLNEAGGSFTVTDRRSRGA